MNISIGLVLVVIGIVMWVLLAFGVSVSVDLWVLGWACVVAGWLLGKANAP